MSLDRPATKAAHETERHVHVRISAAAAAFHQYAFQISTVLFVPDLVSNINNYYESYRLFPEYLFYHS